MNREDELTERDVRFFKAGYRRAFETLLIAMDAAIKRPDICDRETCMAFAKAFRHLLDRPNMIDIIWEDDEGDAPWLQ